MVQTNWYWSHLVGQSIKSGKFSNASTGGGDVAHPEDGQRPGDVCRHNRIVDAGYQRGMLKWRCGCGLTWLSVPEPGRAPLTSMLFPDQTRKATR
jgi:hypothetical protein